MEPRIQRQLAGGGGGGGGGVPGGVNGNIQFNNAGAFGGFSNSDFFFNTTLKRLSINIDPAIVAAYQFDMYIGGGPGVGGNTTNSYLGIEPGGVGVGVEGGIRFYNGNRNNTVFASIITSPASNIMTIASDKSIAMTFGNLSSFSLTGGNWSTISMTTTLAGISLTANTGNVSLTANSGDLYLNSVHAAATTYMQNVNFSNQTSTLYSSTVGDKFRFMVGGASFPLDPSPDSAFLVKDRSFYIGTQDSGYFNLVSGEGINIDCVDLNISVTDICDIHNTSLTQITRIRNDTTGIELSSAGVNIDAISLLSTGDDGKIIVNASGNSGQVFILADNLISVQSPLGSVEVAGNYISLSTAPNGAPMDINTIGIGSPIRIGTSNTGSNVEITTTHDSSSVVISATGTSSGINLNPGGNAVNLQGQMNISASATRGIMFTRGAGDGYLVLPQTGASQIGSVRVTANNGGELEFYSTMMAGWRRVAYSLQTAFKGGTAIDFDDAPSFPASFSVLTTNHSQLKVEDVAGGTEANIRLEASRVYLSGNGAIGSTINIFSSNIRLEGAVHCTASFLLNTTMTVQTGATGITFNRDGTATSLILPMTGTTTTGNVRVNAGGQFQWYNGSAWSGVGMNTALIYTLGGEAGLVDWGTAGTSLTWRFDSGPRASGMRWENNTAAEFIRIGYIAGDPLYFTSNLSGFNITTNSVARFNADTTGWYLSCPSATQEAMLGNSTVNFYVDEGTNTLYFKVKYSSGVVKTGSTGLI